MTTVAPRTAVDALSTAEIDVVASDCVEEIDEALAIVHDGFVEAGYLAPQPSGRRLHLSYLNPGTMFFLARMEGVPVGCCALIADGPFGLPSDRAFVEENDAMRAEGLVPHECGSLAVSGTARRHTRRIIMRVIAAMCRHAVDEYPEAPVPMAVAPENQRFYAAIVGAQEVAGPRPLYGAPATLMRTGGRPLADHAAQRLTPLQRTMDDLITETNPSWLLRRHSGRPLPDSWLMPLVREQGVADRLASQVELLSRRHPRALGVASDRLRASIVA
ncbi:MAG: hypothetical protein AB7V62_07975 [Thermoleophilia bacterium]